MTETNNDVALVTGASSGIGLVTARALANAGYRVFGTSRKPVASTQGVSMLICDVTDQASVRALIEEVVSCLPTKSSGRSAKA